MCDPLKLLRKYNIRKREIVEKNDRIIFGDTSFNKKIKTSVAVYGTKNKEYYTLECLVYFLKYSLKKHIVYLRQAAFDKIPAVKIEDRSPILKYLFGHTEYYESIEKKAENVAKKARLDLELKSKSLIDVMSFDQITKIRVKYLSRKQSLEKNNEIKYLKVRNMNGRF